jgi:hypothetical protein
MQEFLHKFNENKGNVVFCTTILIFAAYRDGIVVFRARF